MSDRERFEQIFRAHYADIVRFALRRAGRAAAEEIAADTFTTCWRRLATVPRDPLPWLYAVARNELLNRSRADARTCEKHRRAQAGVPAWTADPSERVGERDELVRGLQSLHHADAEVLLLVAWEGVSIVDGARIIGVTRAGFAMRLHRARRRLGAALDRQPANQQHATADLECP